jgi:hypothetical protein
MSGGDGERPAKRHCLGREESMWHNVTFIGRMPCVPPTNTTLADFIPLFAGGEQRDGVKHVDLHNLPKLVTSKKSAARALSLFKEGHSFESIAERLSVRESTAMQYAIEGLRFCPHERKDVERMFYRSGSYDIGSPMFVFNAIFRARGDCSLRRLLDDMVERGEVSPPIGDKKLACAFNKIRLVITDMCMPNHFLLKSDAGVPLHK